MKAPSAWELMHVWERGLNLSAADRALIIIEAACPDMTQDDVANLSIGERDSRLLALRQWLFGRDVTSASSCPRCNQLMEWSTNTEKLRLQPLNVDTVPQDHLVTHQDYQVNFRLPNSVDLTVVGRIGDVAAAHKALLKRCITRIERKGKSTTISRLPRKLIQRVIKRMETADPQADLRVELVCANCQHKWEVTFDITSFLWTEIQSWAKQTLRAVHKLAKSYGWREQDILGMSPFRRQLYLEMAGP